MAEIIRAFIAVTLPDEARQELARVSRALAESAPPRAVRWVKPERMHLTLRFLGDTAVSLLPDIAAGLDAAVARVSPFTLRLEGLGGFPNRKRPRVIWAGLQGELERLNGLKREIDAMLEPLGWEREQRPFRAHLTLGRVKNSRQLREIEWGITVGRVAVPVTAVHLIQSTLRPDGPVYTHRHTSPLPR